MEKKKTPQDPYYGPKNRKKLGPTIRSLCRSFVAVPIKIFDRFTSSTSLSDRFGHRSIFAIDRFLLPTDFFHFLFFIFCYRSIFALDLVFAGVFLPMACFIFAIDYCLAQHQTELQTPQKRACHSCFSV